VRASVMRGKKVVARAGARKVTAKSATVKLRLSRKLKRGTYTVKAIAVRAGQQRISRVALRAKR
jgi:methionine-rich copper-binding protein CopC